LTTFDPNQGVRDFPDYDHDNLGECFTAFDLRIRELLETVLHSKCVTIPLQLTEKLVWSGSIADERHVKARAEVSWRRSEVLVLQRDPGLSTAEIDSGQACLRLRAFLESVSSSMNRKWGSERKESRSVRLKAATEHDRTILPDRLITTYRYCGPSGQCIYGLVLLASL